MFPPGPLLLELGSYIILAARSRGDYGWIGQAARAFSLSLLLGYTPGTRQLKKTMEENLN